MDQNAASDMSVRDWLKCEPGDEEILTLIRQVTAWIDSVHRVPPPVLFAYDLPLYGQRIGPFALDGCDVEWDEGMVKDGVLGQFTRSSDREGASRSRALISLTHSQKVELVFVHEIGHLAHTTWLAACHATRIRRLRDQIEATEAYKRLRVISRAKSAEFAAVERDKPKALENVETGKLAYIAGYDASLAEWFSRIYVWTILRQRQEMRGSLMAELETKAVDGITHIYPTEAVMDSLAAEMERVFAPRAGLWPWTRKDVWDLAREDNTIEYSG